ncbi:MAG: GTPase ObgE [Candidatus Poribacteria bacterium]
MFVDRVRIYVKAGNGGNGSISFRREKGVPFGGPNGGDGGRGGNVVAQTIEHLNTLVEQYYTQQYKAKDAGHGMGKGMHGADGADAIIRVPPGTIITDAETGDLVADMTTAGQTAMLVKGGRGGKGNARFKSSTNQAPRVAEKGEPGDEKYLFLELRLIADIGLVGYPNAGKSSILSRVSAAKPKVADYPFTTLTPVLGVVRIDDEKSFVIADIPGLIEGAHEGAGLGDEFLRHITRTRALIHVIDLASIDGRDPVDDYESINEELHLYDEKLAELPQVIAGNKIDLPSAIEGLEKLQDHLADNPERKIIPISALTGEGLQKLLYSAYELLESIPKVEDKQKQSEIIKYSYEPVFNIEKRGEKYVLTGKAVRRAVLMTDMENEFAVGMLHNKLKKMGIIRALQRAGAKDGDGVIVDKVEFTFMS